MKEETLSLLMKNIIKNIGNKSNGDEKNQKLKIFL